MISAFRRSCLVLGLRCLDPGAERNLDWQQDMWLVQLFTGTTGSCVPVGDGVSLLSFSSTNTPWDGWEKESCPDCQGKEIDKKRYLLPCQ